VSAAAVSFALEAPQELATAATASSAAPAASDPVRKAPQVRASGGAVRSAPFEAVPVPVGPAEF
jgi:hypothetical protein